MTSGMGEWGDALSHDRYRGPIPRHAHSKGRRRCRCGCGQWASHVGFANGVALILGCDLLVRRWVRNGRPPFMPNDVESTMAELVAAVKAVDA